HFARVQPVPRPPAPDTKHEHRTRQRAETEASPAKRETGLSLAAHDVDPPTGRLLDGRREGAAVGRLAHGTGRDDADVSRAAPDAALDVTADDSERPAHRRLTHRSRPGEALAEPGDRLVLVDDPPRRPIEHVGDEEPNRIAADIDRGEAHGGERKHPPGLPAGRVNREAVPATFPSGF